MIGPSHPDFKETRTIIGLSGYARTGKNEVASVLDELGFEQFAFADKLRDCLYALNPIVSADFWDDDFIYLQDVMDDFGWDGYKDTQYGIEIRQLIQRMGTEVGRGLIDENIWIDQLDKTSGNIVVTDVRFPNEYMKVKSMGGVVWRVHRPDVGPINQHDSETALDDFYFDAHIDNNSDLDELRRQVGHVYKSMKI